MMEANDGDDRTAAEAHRLALNDTEDFHLLPPESLMKHMKGSSIERPLR
jgi:hypothetical protein